jgi:hypothetical protein
MSVRMYRPDDVAERVLERVDPAGAGERALPCTGWVVPPDAVRW